MNTGSDVLLAIKMLEVGIIPYDRSFSGSQLRAALNTMDALNQRLARRKFRKRWKKIVRSFKKSPHIYDDMKRATGVGLNESQLTNQQRAHRIYLVRAELAMHVHQDLKNARRKN